MSFSGRPQRGEILGGLLVGALLLLPLLLVGPVDNEETGLGIFSSQVYYQALLHGRSLFWLNDLGFGTPMPIGQRLDFHPVFALGNLVSLRVALSALWLVQMALMVVYFVRLAAASGIKPPMRMMLLVCYLGSASTVCYFYQTDWVSVQVAWTLYPVLVFYIRQVAIGEDRESFWLDAVRLAVVAGFMILNSHPGYLAPLFVVAGVYAIALSPDARGRACLLAALALAAVVSLERGYAMVNEMRLFPPGLPREAQGGYRLTDFAQAIEAPFGGVHPNLRLPFIGIVLGGCAVAAAVRVRGSRDVHTRACVAAFLVALTLGFAPQSLTQATRVFSAAWLFRDPMLFFGLMAGGLTLQLMYESRTLRSVVWGLVAVQLVQQAATIRPGVADWRFRVGQQQFYRYQGQTVGVARVLADRAAQFGKRLYMSEDVRTLMRGALSRDGIHVVTDLAFVGVDPINVWFKDVSMDRLHPSLALMHGLIAGQREVIDNPALLDVAGIDLVLVSDHDPEPPSGLVPTDRVEIHGHRTLVLAANRDAWPTAVLMTAGTQDVRLALRPGCPHEGAMCRDFTPLVDRRLPDPVALRTADGLYRARFDAAGRERLLFVSALYRPEWRARTGTVTLPVAPVANAFLGVTVPPGVDEVELAFVPTGRIVLAGVSGVALAGQITAFVILWWRRRGAHSSL